MSMSTDLGFDGVFKPLMPADPAVTEVSIKVWVSRWVC